MGWALGSGLAAAALGTWYLGQHDFPLWFCWVTNLSVVTLLVFGLDKLLARLQSRRISERALLGLSLLGGSPGALLAMPLFRHKTVKGSFRRAFFGILAIQLLGTALAWWLLRDGGVGVP
ncbi:MAG: cyanate transport [Planctomycetota bacterium]|nr:MAG: cyanate transport [Planctomycetota bacterium]